MDETPVREATTDAASSLEGIQGLEQWLSQSDASVKAIDAGCHCGEECAAHYNLD